MLMKYDVLGTVTKELHSTTIYTYIYIINLLSLNSNATCNHIHSYDIII